MQALRAIKQRYPVIFGVVVGTLAAASAAVAAFIVYSGIDGTSNGNFQTSSTMPAITFGGDESQAIGPGSTVTLPITLTNNDSNAAHTVENAVATITSTPTICASHMSVTGFSAVDGQTVTAGGTVAINTGVQIVADNSLPASCASGTFSISWSGDTG